MQNFGFKPNINKFLANQTGYGGDFGGGQFSNWLQSQQGAQYAPQVQSYMTGVLPGQQRSPQIPAFNFGAMGAVNPASMNLRTRDYNIAGAALTPSTYGQQQLLQQGVQGPSFNDNKFVKGATLQPQQAAASAVQQLPFDAPHQNSNWFSSARPFGAWNKGLLQQAAQIPAQQAAQIPAQQAAIMPANQGMANPFGLQGAQGVKTALPQGVKWSKELFPKLGDTFVSSDNSARPPAASVFKKLFG